MRSEGDYAEVDVTRHSIKRRNTMYQIAKSQKKKMKDVIATNLDDAFDMRLQILQDDLEAEKDTEDIHRHLGARMATQYQRRASLHAIEFLKQKVSFKLS